VAGEQEQRAGAKDLCGGEPGAASVGVLCAGEDAEEVGAWLAASLLEEGSEVVTELGAR
jgi:hypothetical protein